MEEKEAYVQLSFERYKGSVGFYTYKVINHLVLEMIFKRFFIIDWHGGHLGHMTMAI